MFQARKTAAAADLAALVSFMTGQQKNATADLVGFLNSLKQPRQINFTIPQLQLPQLVSDDLPILGQDTIPMYRTLRSCLQEVVHPAYKQWW